MVRPENIKVSVNPLKDGIKGVVTDVIYDGAITKLFVDTEKMWDLKVNVHGIVDLHEGDNVYVKIDEDVVVPIRGKNYEKK